MTAWALSSLRCLDRCALETRNPSWPHLAASKLHRLDLPFNLHIDASHVLHPTITKP